MTILVSAGPFTILAPVDSAFEVIDVDALLNDKTQLTEVLLRHVIDGEVTSKDVSNGPVKSKGGDILTANVDSGVGQAVLKVLNDHSSSNLISKLIYSCLKVQKSKI